jgi:FAD/FMN-containing dehydrogenase
MWYPALAPPAGIVPLDALNRAPGIPGLDVPSQGGNIDMTKVGGAGGPNSSGTTSHSYMSMKKYHEVWNGFRAFRAAFAQ